MEPLTPPKPSIATSVSKSIASPTASVVGPTGSSTTTSESEVTTTSVIATATSRSAMYMINELNVLAPCDGIATV